MESIVKPVVVSIGDFRKDIKQVLDFVYKKRGSAYLRRHRNIVAVLIPPIFSTEDVDNETVKVAELRDDLKFFIQKIDSLQKEKNKKWFHVKKHNEILATFGKNSCQPKDFIEWADYKTQ